MIYGPNTWGLPISILCWTFLSILFSCFLYWIISLELSLPHRIIYGPTMWNIPLLLFSELVFYIASVFCKSLPYIHGKRHEPGLQIYLIFWEIVWKYKTYMRIVSFGQCFGPLGYFLGDMNKTKWCNGFYIEFRQNLEKETFSYDEHLKS